MDTEKPKLLLVPGAGLVIVIGDGYTSAYAFTGIVKTNAVKIAKTNTGDFSMQETTSSDYLS
jgi:hypothetical protein